VPVGEVEIVLVNGISVGLAYTPEAGDHVSLYPVFESFDVSSLAALRGGALRQSRFIVDSHLAKLAKLLRMLGFDAACPPSLSPSSLVRTAEQELRIILTRSKRLLERKAVRRGLLVISEDPRAQLKQVLHRFNLERCTAPFTRCIRCNVQLEPAAPPESALPAAVAACHGEFQHCPACRRLYWKGRHYRRMKEWISTLEAEDDRQR